MRKELLYNFIMCFYEVQFWCQVILDPGVGLFFNIHINLSEWGSTTVVRSDVAAPPLGLGRSTLMSSQYVVALHEI